MRGPTSSDVFGWRPPERVPSSCRSLDPAAARGPRDQSGTSGCLLAAPMEMEPGAGWLLTLTPPKVPPQLLNATAMRDSGAPEVSAEILMTALGSLGWVLAGSRSTANGASRPLRRIPAIVSFLNPQPPLSLVGGNRSSCPKAVSDSGKLEEACGRKMGRCGAEIDPFAPDPAHQPRSAMKATTRLRGCCRISDTAAADSPAKSSINRGPICPAKTTRKG
jgi:hypothetical protein